MNEALAVARDRGVLGPDVLGTGLPFDVEVFVSPGGYVCGEQGALIEAIEEHRAEPRNRPPQLETNGLFDKPTLLSNVETFAWVPAIALNGGKWYADSGRKGGPWYTAKGKAGAAGLRFFSICGDVRKPGVYEVEIGSTLGELIDLAGGVRDGLPLKAVAPSGPSGGFIPAVLSKADVGARFERNFPAGRDTLDIRELPLDIDEFRSLESDARRRTDRLCPDRGHEHARPRPERLAVLPQRVVRQVRSLPDRLAKARLDRRADRAAAGNGRGPRSRQGPGERAAGDPRADLDLRPGHVGGQAAGHGAPVVLE